MDNSELSSEISLWQKEIIKPDFNDKLIELAFFKIFVKFEKFISAVFIHYALGKKSSRNFKPKRKLGFSTFKQLTEVIRGSNKEYVDFPKIISAISSQIFEEKSDPFNLIFNDSKFLDNYKKMQYIRNFIAHESEESKDKYMSRVLATYNIRAFKDPHEFLLMKNKRSNSYYSFYINIVIDYSEILIYPVPFLT